MKQATGWLRWPWLGAISLALPLGVVDGCAIAQQMRGLEGLALMAFTVTIAPWTSILGIACAAIEAFRFRRYSKFAFFGLILNAVVLGGVGWFYVYGYFFLRGR